jgi:hypothetical protein
MIRYAKPLVARACFVVFCSLGGSAFADPLACDVTGYKAAEGLSVQSAADALTVSWQGDPGHEVRLAFAVEGGAPKIKDLSLRRDGGAWSSLAADLSPDFHVTTGLRRMSNQQLRPLNDLKVPITEAEVAKHRWDPFWDAPLDMATAANPNVNNPPPKAGLPGQPGLPRDPSEVKEADAVYAVKGCVVRTDGARIEISFPGVTLGVFQGKLMYTVYRGSNLIRQEVVASTQTPWVAYKYEAGLKGLPIRADSKVAWRDISNTWQRYRFGGAVNADKVPLLAANRIAVADQGVAGSIAAFPPPHKFFWAREVSINMGYNWYRKDSDAAYAFGIRQNEKEDPSENPANWALYSARPGTDQLMPVYLYPTLGDANATAAGAMAFTRGDTFKAVPGYKVMNHHYHMDLGARWLADGVRTKIPDLVALKAVGLDIVSPIWSFNMFGFDGADPNTVEADAMDAAQKALPRGANYLAFLDAAAKGAKIHSDKDFLIMPNIEVYGGPLGGHTDLLFSRPVMMDQKKPGQAAIETDPKYGRVYHIGSAKEFMDMARAENVLISMPHPRTKGSAGYPDADKDTDYFNDPQYNGFGLRWGMGLDGSERRTCELRCLPVLDDMSNWMAARGQPMKYALSISEVRHQQPGDDIYASAPVTYVKLAEQPMEPTPVVEALKRGDSFVTTGEVLLTHYEVQSAGRASKLVAEVEWTFPLDMVEIVWGDGKITGRQIIPTTDLPPFGKHRFEIPFDARGKSWVRFAAWDSASEGALSQPVALSPPKARRRNKQ